MPNLLLELFCEEIPARLQKRAAEDLKKRVTDALVDAGLTYVAATPYWTPRRLVLDVRDLTARSPDLKEERKGPRVGVPEKAIEGFLRGAGLTSVDQAEIRNDPKKGEFYVAVIEKPGRDAQEIIAEIIPPIIREFSWPKSMRWGEASREPGSLRWIRPLQSILCTLGAETGETEIISFKIEGLLSSDQTFGHRFHAPEAIKVRRFDDYVSALEKAHVVLDADRRKEIIRADAQNLAFAQGLELVEDEGLLDEVANLVEWPVALMGEFNSDFLDIPPKVIQLTIRTNQKCFVLRDAKSKSLTNKFILVANIEASDGGVEIARGNAKVVNARLSDAKFFWESDLATIAKDGFSPWIEKLDAVTFHAKLGTQGERVQRIKALAKELAPLVGADPDLASRAAELCKADLNSAMVYEFPEVQGEIGRIYGSRNGEDASVCVAIEDHYKPQGPSDQVPKDPVAIAVALADKLDILVGFWAIDEKPTGSKDPFALRRAALGVIRILLENGIRIKLQTVTVSLDLLSFFHDRLKVYLRDQGARHDLIDAVLSNPSSGLSGHLLPQGEKEEKAQVSNPSSSPPAGEDSETQRSKAELSVENGEGYSANDDLLDITRRVEALTAFLNTENGKNLITGTKRAGNILSLEEKKSGAITSAPLDSLLEDEAEKTLFTAVNQAASDARQAVEKEDYSAAMSALAALREPVDSFFEQVMVNVDDENLRLNRLALLASLRDATRLVADFSKIEG